MTTMTLAQLILACSLSSSAHVHDTLHRVVMASSQGHTFWIATSTGHVYTPAHLERALSIVDGLDTQTLHLGLAALSTTHLKRLEFEPAHAMDSCTNLGMTSLELERVLPKKGARTAIQAMHKALALYYSPLEPEGMGALSFGAKVLATPTIDVSKEAASEHPSSGPTFTVSLDLFGGQGAPLEFEATEEAHIEGAHPYKEHDVQGVFGGQGAPQQDAQVSPVPESQPAPSSTESEAHIKQEAP